MFKKKKENKIDIQTIEHWLNLTLKEVDGSSLQSFGHILKRGNRFPMQDFEIDRLTLSNCGLSNKMIDQIYRAFYIHILSFFSELESCVNMHCNNLASDSSVTTHKNKSSLISALWRVYHVLMEQAHRTKYEMQIHTVIEDHVTQAH